jgi:hypothetical protein
MKDSFDALYAEGDPDGLNAPKMMSIGMHCRLLGRPGRITALQRFLDHVQAHDQVWVCRRLDVATHWAASVMRDMIAAFQSGDIATARTLNARMLESYSFETGDLNPNPVPTKAMLRALGQPAGPCRPPMGFGPEDLEARALAVHERLYA